MQPSKLNTVAVADVGAKNPTIIVVAGKQPMRVVLRNKGSNGIYVAHSAANLNVPIPTADTFLIDPDDEEVIVLAPKQGLWCAGQGDGGILCFAASEAIPTTYMES